MPPTLEADRRPIGCPDGAVESTSDRVTDPDTADNGCLKVDVANLKRERIGPGSPVIKIKRDKNKIKVNTSNDAQGAEQSSDVGSSMIKSEDTCGLTGVSADQGSPLSLRKETVAVEIRQNALLHTSNSDQDTTPSSKSTKCKHANTKETKHTVCSGNRSKDSVLSNSSASRSRTKTRVSSDSGDKRNRVRGWVHRMVKNKSANANDGAVKVGLKRNRSVVSRKQGTPWHQIGNVVLNMMKFLDAADICTASQVCGLWCDIGTLDEVWKPVYMNQFLLPPPTGTSGTRGWKWWYKARVVSPTHAIVRPEMVGQGRVDISTADSIHISVMGENEKGMWEMLRLFYLRWEEKPMRLSDFWWNEVRMAFTLKTTANSRGQKVNLNLMDVTMGMGLEWNYFRQMGLQLADVHLLCFNLTDRDTYDFACNTLAPEIIASNRPFVLVGLHHDFILDRGARTISADPPESATDTDTNTHSTSGTNTHSTHTTTHTGSTQSTDFGGQISASAHTVRPSDEDRSTPTTDVRTNSSTYTGTNNRTQTDTQHTRTHSRSSSDTRSVEVREPMLRPRPTHTRKASQTISESELDSFTRLIPYTEGVRMAGEIGAAGYFECSSRESKSVDTLMRMAASVAINDKPKSIIDKCKIS